MQVTFRDATAARRVARARARGPGTSLTSRDGSAPIVDTGR
jgi:hypothetical protein